MIRIEGSAAGAAVLTLAWTIAGAARLPSPSGAATSSCRGPSTAEPSGRSARRAHASPHAQSELAPAAATLSLVLASPDQTIALRRDRDDGSIFGKATQIDADGRVRTAPVLFFLNGFDKLKPDTVFAAGTGSSTTTGAAGATSASPRRWSRLGEKPHATAAPASTARTRSAMRSSACSRPTVETQHALADAEFGPGLFRQTLVRRGGRVGDQALASPRLLEILTIFSAFSVAKAAALPPFTSKATMVEPRIICLAQTSAWGWSGSPGYITVATAG